MNATYIFFVIAYHFISQSTGMFRSSAFIRSITHLLGLAPAFNYLSDLLVFHFIYWTSTFDHKAARFVYLERGFIISVFSFCFWNKWLDIFLLFPVRDFSSSSIMAAWEILSTGVYYCMLVLGALIMRVTILSKEEKRNKSLHLTQLANSTTPAIDCRMCGLKWW